MPPPENNPYFIFHDFEGTSESNDRTRLDEWPLHFTVTPFYTLGEVPEGRMLDTVTTVAEAALPIDVTPGDEAYYGPHNDIRVTKIDNASGELLYFHKELIAKLGEIGCHIIDMTYAGDRYSPHVSHKDGAPLLTDANYAARSISVGMKLEGMPKPNKAVIRRVDLP